MSAASDIMPAETDAVAEAVRLLRDGEIVAIPTETVYGLAADATNGKAVAKIYQAKGRPSFNPLICHVDSRAMAEQHGEFNATARRLADAFWPGPLTLVVPIKATSTIHPLVRAGLDTIGLRQPKGIAADIIARTGKPLAAPSANASGKLSPTTADAVAASLGDAVSLIVDAGPCPVGLESTIVRVDGDLVTLLRPGGVPREAIEAALGHTIVAHAGDHIQAPGMMASHYAPNAYMRLNAQSVEPGEALLAFGPGRIAGAEMAPAVENLSPSGDLVEAAANLFSMMAALDASGASLIAVEPVPMEGLGEAINDRLARAAAPREVAGNE